MAEDTAHQLIDAVGLWHHPFCSPRKNAYLNLRDRLRYRRITAELCVVWETSAGWAGEALVAPFAGYLNLVRFPVGHFVARLTLAQQSLKVDPKTAMLRMGRVRARLPQTGAAE